tara:strand:+ start:44 stop:1306 length:1263 start_codon:yes stop_codon:yes gene_type:complete
MRKYDKDKLLKESKTFCMAPWIELHVLNTGEVYPCCASDTQQVDGLGNLSKGDTLLDAWNSKAMKKLRTDMLNERRNHLCEYCNECVDNGTKSDRDTYNKKFPHHIDRVKYTKDDGELEIFDPPYLDIRFSNICNFSCRMCEHELSTAWYKDALKLNYIDSTTSELITPTENPKDFWEQIKLLIPTVEMVQWAGGEPLVTEEHWKILKMLIDAGKTDVEITYSTNFSKLVYKGIDVLDYWKEFNNIQVNASIDGMGKQGEYLRKGMKWDRIVENRKKMKDKCPDAYFRICAVVSVMNIFHILDFYKWCVDSEFILPTDIQLDSLSMPEQYNIQGLPLEVKSKVVKRYNEFFESYLVKFDDETLDYVKNQFENILNHMNVTQTSTIDNFLEENNKLDNIRNENFSEVFPEVYTLLKDYYEH